MQGANKTSRNEMLAAEMDNPRRNCGRTKLDRIRN